MYILEIANGYPFDSNPSLGLFELDQAKALSGLGHKVVFAGIDLRSIRRKRKLGLSIFKNGNVKVYNYTFPVGRVPAKFSALFFTFFLKKIYRIIEKNEGKPDILHAHFGFPIGYAATRLKQKYQIPCVITEHNSALISGIKALEHAFYRDAYNSADAIIAVGSCLKEKISILFALNAQVIYNIVDMKVDKPRPRNKGNGFTFLSIGALIDRKGFDVLIKALSNIPNVNIKLVIIGEGEQRLKLEKLIDSHNLNDRVSLVGYKNRNEIASLLQNADAFVLASRAETFGIVYIEALAMGKPIIATNCGGPSDIVTVKNGYMVDVNDIGGLALAMQKMIQDYDFFDCEQIARDAYQKYSPQTIAQEIEKVFNAVLRK